MASLYFHIDLLAAWCYNRIKRIRMEQYMFNFKDKVAVISGGGGGMTRRMIYHGDFDWKLEKNEK